MVAVMTAVCFVATRFLGIPWGAGYFHLGDAIIFISAIVLGPAAAAVTGGLGGLLSNLTSGHAAFAPFTVVIKAAMGLSFGFLYSLIKGKKNRYLAVILAGLAAVAILVFGYFIAYLVILDTAGAAAALMPFDLTQGVIAVLITLLLVKRIEKIRDSTINKNDGNED